MTTRPTTTRRRTSRWLVAGALVASAACQATTAAEGPVAGPEAAGGTAGAYVAAQGDDRGLERLEPVLERLGLDYGSTVDDADARRLADKFEMDTGAAVDRSDVDRMVAVGEERIAIADELLPWFERLGRGYGSVVDPTDSHLLATWLRVAVGRAVDRGDVDEVVAAARFEVEHPRFATAVDVLLRLPSDQVELVGFHQSNHDGARGMSPHGDLGITMESRDRDTHPRGSADVALPKDVPVYSPVTGTVLRAGTYTLYCDHRDDYVVVDPDDHPGWEVKILHIDGVRVRKGDRVEAGVTLLAPRATVLPFESQVNDHTRERDTPHVHVEVVDPSIPDRPSSGGGC